MKNPEELSGVEQGPFKKVKIFEPSHLNEISSPSATFIARQIDANIAANYLNIDNKDPVEVALKTKDVFDRLKNRYGIPVNVNVVLADDQIGEPVLNIITDRIDGNVLTLHPEGDEFGWFYKKSESERARFVSELDSLLSSLSLYLLDNYKKDDFMWDIFPLHQYMWGKKRNEGENGEDHLYLVDIDIHRTNTFTPLDNRKEDALNILSNFIQVKKDYEYRCGVIFTKTDEAIQKLVQAGLISLDKK